MGDSHQTGITTAEKPFLEEWKLQLTDMAGGPSGVRGRGW
jgi:hypothetical protein